MVKPDINRVNIFNLLTEKGYTSHKTKPDFSLHQEVTIYILNNNADYLRVI